MKLRNLLFLAVNSISIKGHHLCEMLPTCEPVTFKSNPKEHMIDRMKTVPESLKAENIITVSLYSMSDQGILYSMGAWSELLNWQRDRQPDKDRQRKTERQTERDSD